MSCMNSRKLMIHNFVIHNNAMRMITQDMNYLRYITYARKRPNLEWGPEITTYPDDKIDTRMM